MVVFFILNKLMGKKIEGIHVFFSGRDINCRSRNQIKQVLLANENLNPV